MDSLRLLCTTSRERAVKLAMMLGVTNRQRQILTQEMVLHAKLTINKSSNQKLKKLLFIAHETYQPGVIGLVAGKMVEEFYRPTIVVAMGDPYSKASARSVNGFNIIEFIRQASDFLIDAGGHPMAAGFTVETTKLLVLQEKLEKLAEEMLRKEDLIRTLRIDCELSLEQINQDLYEEIQKLSPFGMGNPEPTFVSKDVVIDDMRVIGRDRRHLKFKFQIPKLKSQIDAIGFGLGEKAGEFNIGDLVDIVYTIDENVWNGNKSLQLKIKDLRFSMVS